MSKCTCGKAFPTDKRLRHHQCRCGKYWRKINGTWTLIEDKTERPYKW